MPMKKVQARFAELGIRVRSVHREKDPVAAIRSAQGIVVGGGNTFRPGTDDATTGTH